MNTNSSKTPKTLHPKVNSLIKHEVCTTDVEYRYPAGTDATLGTMNFWAVSAAKKAYYPAKVESGTISAVNARREPGTGDMIITVRMNWSMLTRIPDLGTE